MDTSCLDLSRIKDAHQIDIYDDYAIVTLHLTAESMKNIVCLKLPTDIELESVKVTDPNHTTINHTIHPSAYSTLCGVFGRDDHSFAPVQVMDSQGIIHGMLVSTDSESVTITTERGIEKIYHPSRITTSEKGNLIHLYGYDSLSDIYVQYVSKHIKLRANYHIDLLDDTVSIVRRYHITNDRLDFAMASVKLYAGSVGFEPDSSRELLTLSTPFSPPGLVVNMNSAIVAKYKKYYRHVVGSDSTDLVFSFESPKSLTAGLARVYRDARYVGQWKIPELSNPGKVEIALCGSPEGQRSTSTSLLVSGLVTSDVIITPHVDKTDTVVTSPDTSKDSAKEDVTLSVTLYNPYDEAITLLIIYESLTKIVDFVTCKPISGTNIRPEWTANFNPKERSRLQLKFIRLCPDII